MCKEEEKTIQLKEFGQRDQLGRYYLEYEWCDGQTKFWETFGDRNQWRHTVGEVKFFWELCDHRSKSK